MHLHLFAPCQVQYGDSKVRGLSITCGKCGVIQRAPMNTVFNTKGDDRQAELLAMRKFSKMGWEIGRSTARHRCPACIEKRTIAKPFAALGKLTTDNLKKLLDDNIKKEEPAMRTSSLNGGVSLKAMEQSSPQVREMSLEDRHVVFAKLQDVYDMKAKSYTADWSDKRVSEDLGVPRAWVSEVRGSFFGPDRNAEFEEQILVAKTAVDDFKKLTTDAAAIAAAQQKLSDRIVPMASLIERLEKSIAAIEKKYVP